MELLTREEALKKYKMYLQAEEDILVTGQSYALGNGNELTRVDLEKVRKGLDYWERKFHNLNGHKRSARFIPIDR